MKEALERNANELKKLTESPNANTELAEIGALTLEKVKLKKELRSLKAKTMINYKVIERFRNYTIPINRTVIVEGLKITWTSAAERMNRSSDEEWTRCYQKVMVLNGEQTAFELHPTSPVRYCVLFGIR